MASQRLFISTGEVSGDLHGSFLIQALRERRPELEIEALGGQRMAALGVPMLGDTMTLSSIGVVEAIPYILPTLRIQNRLKSFFDRYRPDLVVLIDYIGANVRVGRLARKLGIPVVYYIAPQEWVWSTFRGDTARIVTFSDLILAIFPEEARYYERHGGNVRWIGHPLIDIAQARTSRAAFRELMQTPEASPAVVLAPASRSQELQHLMPLLFETARAIEHTLPAVRFWISASTPRFREAIEQAAAASGIAFQFVPEGRNYDALAAADLLLTKSGTVNLEAALLDLPQVVAYRVDPRTIWVARNLMGFKIPFMCPVNLVDMSPIVPEFLQEKATVEALTAASLELLTNPQAAARMRSEYARIRALLGDAGVVDRAADAILEMLDKRG
ncbi:lipid-A-disaccharide synthase [Gloeobacter kilaueensis]|uniref:Lipid-A-disaccharide synthase n=1 Tax=Gloeobacter kilaueensis (strain ATCC BAA-2537 / CCAP 1431/1 / ULC 316 / JS1) TaxID=1183438 RepID=U5QLT2_GLOK1|nr:lipid-A-disaccharide synthase [Gloeobacter kilaueensis]AGY58579.1 lipid-A-disaccharide synthase [Gloeobacter kilaueensis JS1]